MAGDPHSTTALRATALRLATQVTPIQRRVLGLAGMPRWLALPAPWQPMQGRQLAVARALASAEYRLLEPVPTYLGAYHLTPLGEVVGGILLQRGVYEAAPRRLHSAPPITRAP